MQNILNVLTIITFISTAIGWVYVAINSSIRLHAEIRDHIKIQNRIIQLYIYFQNNSGKSITISGVSIMYKGKEHPCRISRAVIQSKGDEILLSATTTPINLSPYQGTCHVLEFLDCRDIELDQGKTLDLEIYTNRRRLKRSLVLPPPADVFRPDHRQQNV